MKVLDTLIDILETIYETDEKSKAEVKAALLKEFEKVNKYAKDKLINTINNDKSDTELMESRGQILKLIDGLKDSPKAKQIVLDNSKGLIALSLTDDWTNRNIHSYGLRDKKTNEMKVYKVSTYRELFKSICKLFYDIDNEIITSIADTSNVMGVKETYISKVETGVKNPVKIADDLYIERKISPPTISGCIRTLLLEYGYMEWDFNIHVK